MEYLKEPVQRALDSDNLQFRNIKIRVNLEKKNQPTTTPLSLTMTTGKKMYLEQLEGGKREKNRVIITLYLL